MVRGPPPLPRHERRPPRARAPARPSSRAIKQAHIVCLLSDRDITGSGVEVEFFGERTTLPGGPATLALRTGAALLPTAVYFRGKGHHATIRAAVPAERRGRLRDDVQRVTQDLAYELEALIRAAPGAVAPAPAQLAQ